MTTEDLYQFKEKLDTEGILFGYSGPVSQGLIEEIGEVIRRRMTQDETRLGIIQKVFGIFVEQVQNIMNYSAERKQDRNGVDKLRSGIVVIGTERRGFFILCGNLVANKDKTRILESLKTVELKSRVELNRLYKERLRAGSPEAGKGAGVGLIDIARKASGPLEYTMRQLDDTHSFFSTRVVIEEDGR